MANKVGRPTKYGAHILTQTREYIDLCEDVYSEFHKTRGINSDSYERLVHAKIPSIEGLGEYLDIADSTLHLWRQEYKEFSEVIDKLLKKQARMLFEGGLSGTYNPTIAKVLLTKHGYREGHDNTTNGKDLPIPIFGAINPHVSDDNSNQKVADNEEED